jgi:protein-tyrosine phosphatase
MKVLFVCTGNTCRSVLAEQLLKTLAQERGLDWEVRSCGTAADPRIAVTAYVRKLVREMGVSDFQHRASPLSTQAVAWADVVLSMTKAQLSRILHDYPEAEPKAFMLTEYADLGREDIEDPIGGDEDRYRAALAEIRVAVERVLEKRAPKSDRRRG